MSSLDLNKVFLRERKGWGCCSYVPICMICLYVVTQYKIWLLVSHWLVTSALYSLFNTCGPMRSVHCSKGVVEEWCVHALERRSIS